MTVGERLEQIRASFGLTQADFAAQCGVPLRTYSNYATDKRPPSHEVLQALAGKGINLNWLLTGEGEMLAIAGEQTNVGAGAPVERDQDLYGRVLEAISAVYKEMNWGISLRQLGAEAAQIADDIAAEGLAPDEKPPAVKAAAAMLRRQLRAAAADPTAEASTKGRA
jgi:transcriptional regulator with XRE-family HTH domain